MRVDCRKHPQRRAQWEYLRGKVLDVGPDYCKEAEEHLSKSVSYSAHSFSRKFNTSEYAIVKFFFLNISYNNEAPS